MAWLDSYCAYINNSVISSYLFLPIVPNRSSSSNIVENCRGNPIIFLSRNKIWCIMHLNVSVNAYKRTPPDPSGLGLGHFSNTYILNCFIFFSWPFYLTVTLLFFIPKKELVVFEIIHDNIQVFSTFRKNVKNFNLNKVLVPLTNTSCYKQYV